MTNTQASLSAMSSKMAKELSFTVQKTHAIDDRQARMAILIEPVYQSRISEEALESAVAKQYPNVRYQKNSIHRMSNTDKRLFGIYVVRNDRTMSMENAAELASAEKMTKINDTVYQDANDDILDNYLVLLMFIVVAL